MARPKSDRPSYCKHKRTGRGYATVDGKEHWFPGAHGSPESLTAYDRLIGSWLSNNRALPAVPVEVAGPTVAMICAEYWRHCKARYVNTAGESTGEAENFKLALRPLKRLYGSRPAPTFGPKDLKALRSTMLLKQAETDPTTGEKTTRPGWSRNYANRQMHRIKRIFKWAASEQLVPAAVYHGLATVESIAAGQENARETDPVLPVRVEDVEATLPHLPPPVAAMVRLQLLSGARGGELFKLTTRDIDRSGAVWRYTPENHKTARHGVKRTILFGPKAQEVLQPFLRLDPALPLFRPIDAHEWRNERARANRKTPMTPSQLERAKKAAKRSRKLRLTYDKRSYSQAVARAAHRAQVDPWHPHQLRHTAATLYREQGDFETAKIILGHRKDDMTALYAQRNEQKAAAIVAKIG